MAYVDALQDRADIFTITYTKNALLEETKVETPLYTSIPCRLMRNTQIVREGKEGAFESFSNQWLIHVQPSNNNANRKDRCVINGQTYLITSKHEIRGDSAAIHHVIYYLDEQL